MERTFTDILMDLLVIIKYPKHDRQRFVKEFEELNHVEAALNIADRLPGPSKIKIKMSKGNPEVLHKYIDGEKYTVEMTKVSAKALVSFISVVSPLLTLDQKEKIIALMQKDFYLNG